MQYWYNVRTGEVEPDDATSRKDDLMGPYGSREEAQAALQTAADRTAQWDEEDRREAEAQGRDPDEGGLLG